MTSGGGGREPQRGSGEALEKGLTRGLSCDEEGGNLVLFQSAPISPSGGSGQQQPDFV